MEKTAASLKHGRFWWLAMIEGEWVPVKSITLFGVPLIAINHAVKGPFADEASVAAAAATSRQAG